MRDLHGKAAVVTGAASGIGRALALHAAGLGMRVAVADVDEAGLEATRKAVSEVGVECLAQRTDVRTRAALEALADASFEAFGGVDLLFNNAGVLVAGSGWERSEDDWQWQLGVNVFGVINGVSAFVPRMIARGEPARIVNTSSVGGLLVGPFITPYIVSKHAVLAYSEALHHEFKLRGTPVAVSVLCPGAVDTGITRSERVRPAELQESSELQSDVERGFAEGMRQGIAGGMAPAELARLAFAGVQAGHFWILPDPIFREGLKERVAAILDGRNPGFPGELSLEAVRDAVQR